ncbi:MAG TPA: hypothetical protein VGJ22_05365 [Anaerolineales bacterium]|jgi:hypothetical protein
MRLLFIFMDGIGLGADDPNINPFARAAMPFLRGLLGGRALTRRAAPYEDERTTLLAADAGLGVSGYPQSATGQAVLLTGVNLPAALGYHYGPKPNADVAAYLGSENLFARLTRAGKTSALLNAYPPRYFDGIDSGKRLYSSIPLAVTNAGLQLLTKDDYFEGRAMAADFTGEGWAGFLGYPQAPVFTPESAGTELARLAAQYDFAMFEYWASDYAGHKQDMPSAVAQLERFDGVLNGLLEHRDMTRDLVLITSDHGNMEDLSVRRHTDNAVPVLLFGDLRARQRFADGLTDLADIAPRIWEAVTASAWSPAAA